MGDMKTSVGASRKMLAVDKAQLMDPKELEGVKNNIERFCKLMERGLEVNMPATNSIRVLFMDQERTGIFFAAETADVFKAEQGVKMENVLRFVPDMSCTTSPRILLKHKNPRTGQEETMLIDVDTNKSRDIMASMLSKVVSVYRRAPPPGAAGTANMGMGEEVTITGALSSVIKSISSSFWGMGPNTDTDKPVKPQKIRRQPSLQKQKSLSLRRSLSRKLSRQFSRQGSRTTATTATATPRGSSSRLNNTKLTTPRNSNSKAASTAAKQSYRRQMSTEGRDLFRNSLDGPVTPR
jgi:hypothetical protein